MSRRASLTSAGSQSAARTHEPRRTSGFVYGPGGELPVDSVPGPVFDQSRDVGPDATGSQLVILFRHDFCDQGAGSVGMPGDYPGCDVLDGVLLFRIVHEISLTPGDGAVYQLACDDVQDTASRSGSEPTLPRNVSTVVNVASFTLLCIDDCRYTEKRAAVTLATYPLGRPPE